MLYPFDRKTKSLILIDSPFNLISAIRTEAGSMRTPWEILKLTISDPSAPRSGVTYQTLKLKLKSSADFLPFTDSIISQLVYATLYPPTNFAYDGSSDPTEKQPCIVNAHGGPAGMAAQQHFISRDWNW
ncbi:hypothetical protein H4582DRAFT_399039 [Lactarius indigo]|nr:hypothetical protein H4582DRAFT_399039 [Lactarius indigo]